MRNLLCAALLALSFVVPSQAQQKWATVKGQVVWPAGPIPKRSPIKLQRCTRPANKGPLLDQTWVINPKNRGIQWVQVYVGVVDKKGKVNPQGKMPIHPDLKAIKNKQVVLDQPCCAFEPHVVGMRVGQTLLVKNSSKTDVHNSNLVGVQNVIIPIGGQFDFGNKWAKPEHFATPIMCNVHPWMKAYVRVFNHPYHTVTDENGNFELKNVPVGADIRLVFWHETGWCVGNFRDGIKIKAPKDGVSDLGKVEIIPPPDDE